MKLGISTALLNWNMLGGEVILVA